MIIERSDEREISYLAYQKAATRLTKLFSLKPRDCYQKVKEYLENELQDICHSPDEWKEVKKPMPFIIIRLCLLMYSDCLARKRSLT